MNISYYTAVSAMNAFQKDLDVTSNNMANISTNGYKSMRSSFNDLLYTQMDMRPQAQVGQGDINRTVAKTVFEEIFDKDVEPEAFVEEKGLKVVNDEGALRSTIERVLAANPQSVADYNGGKERAMGYLVGQTMRAMKGKADPAMVNQIVKELLSC